MKIIKENPPFYNNIIEAGMNPHSEAIYAYGDIIYNPANIFIPDYLLIHEEVHSKQQGNNPKDWWDRYLSDSYFRIEQESEAYAKQYDFMSSKIKDRNQRYKLLLNISNILASPIYGNIISRYGAYDLIKSKIK